MKPIIFSLLLLSIGCNKNDAPEERATPVEEAERAAPPAGQRPPEPENEFAARDALDSADVPVVRHRDWKIGDTDHGEFNERNNEGARQDLPLVRPGDPVKDRNVPEGLIHRYDFEVEKAGYVYVLVNQHAFSDERATPVMALFRDDGTRDKVKIALPRQQAPAGAFEVEKLPTGTYELVDGFGFVVQNLEPGPYVLLVKPADRDAFQTRQRGDNEAGQLPEANFVCMSKCEFCK